MDASERQEAIMAVFDAGMRESMGELYATLARYIKDATTADEACQMLGELMGGVNMVMAGIAAMHDLVHDEGVTLEGIQDNVEGAMRDNDRMNAMRDALKAGDLELAEKIANSLDADNIEEELRKLDPNDLDNLLSELGLSVEVTEDHPDESENAA